MGCMDRNPRERKILTIGQSRDQIIEEAMRRLQEQEDEDNEALRLIKARLDAEHNQVVEDIRAEFRSAVDDMKRQLAEELENFIKEQNAKLEKFIKEQDAKMEKKLKNFDLNYEFKKKNHRLDGIAAVQKLHVVKTEDTNADLDMDPVEKLRGQLGGNAHKEKENPSALSLKVEEITEEIIQIEKQLEDLEEELKKLE